MNPFTKGKELIEHIEKHGYQAYFVGGCVRDSIMGRTIGDIDIATSAKPSDVQGIFTNVIPVGMEHGTVIVRWEKESYEVTTFRVEGTYSDQRHPDDVSFVQTIDQDLERRDFTMNAIAMDRSGNIIDPFNGQADIKKKQIRAVGNGFKRFTEDSLRIIRAIRFSSQLGFSIEKETLHAMLKVKKQISALAVERLAVEMTNFFAGSFITAGMPYLKDTHILIELPVFKEHPKLEQVLPERMLPLKSFSETVAMFRYLYPPVSISEWVHKWKASNRTKREAIQLYEALVYFNVNGLDSWFAYSLPETSISKFTRLAALLYPQKAPETEAILQIKTRIAIQSKSDLVLNGNDISGMFPNRKKGAWIGTLLSEMEHAVVAGSVKNNKYALEEWIRCLPPKEN